MRISRGSDYGLLALHYLTRLDQGERASVKDVAKFYQIPEPYLAKIVKSLVRAGLVQSQRGANGGIRLAKPAPQISFKDVLEAIDGRITIVECLDPKCECGRESECPFPGLWDDVQGEIHKILQRSTLADFDPPSRASYSPSQ